MPAFVLAADSKIAPAVSLPLRIVVNPDAVLPIVTAPVEVPVLILVSLNGDVLFKGSFGRTDLPGGDLETLKRSIHEVLFQLPDDTIVYCGHGPSTTIGIEKQTNYILQF
jgi:hypothetical protein